MSEEALAKAYIFLQQSKNSCRPEDLREHVAGTFSYEMLDRSPRFVLVNNGEFIACVNTSEDHPSVALPMDDTFGFLQALWIAVEQHGTSWPDKKSRVRQFVPAQASIDVILADCIFYRYVKMVQGGKMSWNEQRVRALCDLLPGSATTTSQQAPREHSTERRRTSRERSRERRRKSREHSREPRRSNTTSREQQNTERGRRLQPTTEEEGDTIIVDDAPQGRNRDKVGDDWRTKDGVRCRFIKQPQVLRQVLDEDPAFFGGEDDDGNFSPVVTFDCEGVPSALEVVQVSTNKGVYVFDARLLGAETLCEGLRPLLCSKTTLKVMHDLHQDALALKQLWDLELVNVLDSQLYAEHVLNKTDSDKFAERNRVGMNDVLELLDLPLHPNKSSVRDKMNANESLLAKRPLSAQIIEYAAMDVHYLMKIVPKLLELPTEEQSMLIAASAERAQAAIEYNGGRRICFNQKGGYSMSSTEYLKHANPAAAMFGIPLVVQSDVEEVLHLLPRIFTEKLMEVEGGGGALDFLFDAADLFKTRLLIDLSRLSDIVLDIGRPPQCWIAGKRMFLCENRSILVEERDIQKVIASLGEFGHDNRAGLDGKLHRFSVMRARDERISGLTIRVGRSITGNADLIADLLLGTDKSILFLGEPGSGKTTIVREATRILAEEKNVVVVDTSNEIGGDGLIPHDCIGLARRMMVPSLEEQSKTMIECVQNHTPDVQVIDEIGRPKEVQAARTVKQRGVRIIASAHGDLCKLIKNKELRGLVGGLEQVTMGDGLAKEEAKRKKMLRQSDGEGGGGDFGGVSKTKAQRASDPTFDVIVELRRGEYHNWRVVRNVATAVDAILDGRAYRAEVRRRNPGSGAMFLDYVKVRNEDMQSVL